MQTLEVKQFLHQVADQAQGDFPFAFKMLGFVVYIAEEGSDAFMSGEMISLRTYHRWMRLVNQAGWGDLVADARLRKELQDYMWKRFAGLPVSQARQEIIKTVRSLVTEIQPPSLKATSRQDSETVKGERSEPDGREVQPNALDGRTAGGSLSDATAAIGGWNHGR